MRTADLHDRLRPYLATACLACVTFASDARADETAASAAEPSHHARVAQPTQSRLLGWLRSAGSGAESQSAQGPGVGLPAPLAAPIASGELVANALGLLGITYRRGGNSPESGFDCSGLVRYVFQNAVGVDLPHRAVEISRLGAKVDRDELKPGDLVFYNTLRSAFSHVGIYLGEGRFIHAPSKGREVRIEDMQQAYWTRRFNGARRVAD